MEKGRLSNLPNIVMIRLLSFSYSTFITEFFLSFVSGRKSKSLSAFISAYWKGKCPCSSLVDWPSTRKNEVHGKWNNKKNFLPPHPRTHLLVIQSLSEETCQVEVAAAEKPH